MLAFLLSPPCGRGEPGSLWEARRLAPLGLEGGAPAGLDGKQKRRWTLSFPTHLPGTRRFPRESHRHGQDTTLGALALQEIYPPGTAGAGPRTGRDSRRASARASVPRRLSPAASALPRFLRRSPGSLDPGTVHCLSCPADFGLATIVCSVSARPRSATASGSA